MGCVYAKSCTKQKLPFKFPILLLLFTSVIVGLFYMKCWFYFDRISSWRNNEIKKANNQKKIIKTTQEETKYLNLAIFYNSFREHIIFNLCKIIIDDQEEDDDDSKCGTDI